ncbi:MAG: MetQ/NlpA family ABC transporter substrate-binding protein [Spirochaetaceae bacterium]|nr:MetQ/NlpA family ABC transporter substrate-binding protein [Spirochaetaceae bacterium]MBP5328790.1 MetQ/NlpA family ABC transporter substrate-binding protein [Spirochaetaceae bacterium]
MKNNSKTIITIILVTALIFTSCAGKKTKEVTLKIGTCGSLVEDILGPAKASLKEQGINLEIVQFSDFVTPNRALNSGDIDLNAMQHRVFFANDCASNGYELTAIGNTYLIPMHFYSNKVKSVSEIKDGDEIAIPNDVTNGGRALKILEGAGLITIKKDAAFSPTVADIETYKVKIKIKELAANLVAQALNDVTAAVINGNYAVDFGLKPEQAILQDTTLIIPEYWCLIAVKTENLKDPEKVALYEKVVNAWHTDETLKVYDKYQGSIIPVGWDEDILSKYK